MRLSPIIILLLYGLLLPAQTVSSCLQILKGEVRDRVSNNLLPGARVVLSDEDGAILKSQIVKEDAVFMFTLKCATEYYLEGKKEDYTPEAKLFTTSNEAGKGLNLLVLLDKGDIDFVSDSNIRVQEVEKVTEEVKIDGIPKISPDKIQPIVEKKIEEEAKKEIVKTASPTPDVPRIAPIYFDFNSSYLNKKAKNDLQKIVDLMNKNPRIVIESAAHTDVKGTSNYNMWLSRRRAKRAVDFIIGEGIAPGRIVESKGYGDSRVINKCKKGVDCSELEHAKNRRTEFVIVKM